jgi:tetratricopeptide (TPR) repeat protein
MTTDVNKAPADPQGFEEVFPFWDGYWDELLRGEGCDPEQWLRAHPDGPVELRDLQLLDALDVARQVLNQDTTLDASDNGASVALEGAATPPFLEPGTRLGECRIEGMLGSGGMGEVYLAEHEMLKRKVAVKVLPTHLASDPGAAQRFRKSVQILARLNPHPQIASALHASEYQGRLYLVMEYVPGVDLKAHVRQSGPMSPEQACAVVRQVAVGLDYAHGQGIIHRDIKPKNLMLTPDGAVKILDLGLARLLLPEKADGDASQTNPGAAMGTPDYMAPEQARDARRADARSDLYSLGCTFYYLLTGQAPFEERSQLEKVLAHAVEAPPDIQQARPEVSQAVAAVVQKLLAKQPEERYVSAHALIEALDAATGSAAPSGRDVVASAGRSPRMLSRRQWVRALAAAVVLVVLSSMLALLGNKIVGPPDPVRIVSMEIRHLSGDKVLKFAGIIGSGPSPTPDVGDAVRVRIELNQPAYCYLIAYNPDGREQLCYPKDGATTPEQIKELVFPPGPKEIFRLTDGPGLQAFVLVASRKRLPSFDEWNVHPGNAMWKKAQSNSVWGFDGETFDLLGSVQRGRVEELEPPTPFKEICRYLRTRPGVEAIRAVAFVIQDPRTDNAREQLLRQALENHRRLFGEDHVATATSYNYLAISLAVQGKHADALPLFVRVLAFNRRLGEQRLETATSYTNMAASLDGLARHDEAEPQLRKALEILRQALGEPHPNTATSYNNLAYNLDTQGKHAEAEPLYRKALEIRRKALGEDHPDTARSYNNLAGNLQAQGKYGEAEPLRGKALEIYRKTLGEDHPDTARSYNNLAYNLDTQGRYNEAESLYHHGLKIWLRMQAGDEENSDQQLQRTAELYDNLGMNLHYQGKHAAADLPLCRALEIRRQILGEEHLETAKSRQNVARNLEAMKAKSK